MRRVHRKIVNYIESLTMKRKGQTEYDHMTQSEKLELAIDDICGKFCPGPCHVCGSHRVLFLTKSQGGGLRCESCGSRFYMMINKDKVWELKDCPHTDNFYKGI